MLKRIIPSLAGSIIGSIVFVFFGLLILRLFLMVNHQSRSGWEDLIYGILMVIIMHPLGSAIGGWVVLRNHLKHGVVWLCFLAGYSGVGVVMLLAEPLGLNQNTNLLMSLIYIMPVLAVQVILQFYSK
ncbi:MAG: hypothetical protein AB1522_08120 [Chloroflexota bacterium]